MERKVLYAKQGRVLTDGETYGKVIYLAEGADPDKYREITEEEYERILAEQAKRDPFPG